MDVDHFIKIADAIEEQYPKIMVNGEETEGGLTEGKLLFEVKAEDGQVLFSARQTGRLPDSGEILDALTAAGVSKS
ncbi:g4099 [Coccomyxa elongata]